MKIKQIDGQWFYQTTTWTLLDEPSAFTKQRCAMFRLGQKDRKSGKGCAESWGSYLDGWYNPELETPPYISEAQAKAFNL